MNGIVNAWNYNASIKTENKEISDILESLCDDVRGCSVIGWDIFEIGSTTTNGVPVNPSIARHDFLHNSSNWSPVNNRIDYCKTSEDVVGRLMDLSLSYEMLEARIIKDNSHTKAVVSILISLSDDGMTNIDADVIQKIAELGQTNFSCP